MARQRARSTTPNIYPDASGFDTLVQWRGEQKRERWPLDTPLEEMQRWVQRAKSELMDRAADAGTTRISTRGTLTADVESFLKTRNGRPGYKADVSHLKAWTARYGKRRRSLLKTADVNLAIAAWRSSKVSPQTIIHRCRALRVLWRHFDGKKARTPVDEAQVPKRPHPHPVGLPSGILRTVADQLKARTAKYAKTREKTYARFLVLATTLQRPIQMVRAKPEDIDLVTRTWLVRSAKGEPAHQVYLNDEMVAAWQRFIAADAWGPYNGSRFREQLRKATYPAHISTYNMRHEGAMDALRRGADLGDVQGLLGHTDITTTRRNYGPVLVDRQRRISAQLENRVSPPSVPNELPNEKTEK